MTGNCSKSYLGYLNELVEEYNNKYCFMGKNPFMLIILRCLNRVIKPQNLKLVIESGLLSTRIKCSKEIL